MSRGRLVGGQPSNRSWLSTLIRGLGEPVYSLGRSWGLPLLLLLYFWLLCMAGKARHPSLLPPLAATLAEPPSLPRPKNQPLK